MTRLKVSFFAPDYYNNGEDAKMQFLDLVYLNHFLRKKKEEKKKKNIKEIK